MDQKSPDQVTDQEIERFLNPDPGFTIGTPFSDRIVFPKKIQVLDGRNIQVGKGTGTQIGTEAAQKIAFHGAVPVVQAGAVTAPSGGATVDAECRTAVIALIAIIKNHGLSA